MSCAAPLPADSNEQPLRIHAVVNFSRKRGVDQEHSPSLHCDGRGSKRHRHTDWTSWQHAEATGEPESEPELEQELEQERVQGEHSAMSPVRPSKFLEASMNDRPSEKPPSIFTRHRTAVADLAVDELMSQYHADSHNYKPLPPHAAGHTRVRTLPRPSRSPDRSKHSTQTPFSAFSPDTHSDEAKASGLFKFGKSMASAFNPLSVWSRLATGWRAAKDEPADELDDAQKRRQMVEQQKVQAAHMYAHLKDSGYLSGLGAHKIDGASTAASGGNSTLQRCTQRDSGISLGEPSRVCIDTSKSSSVRVPGTESTASRRHVRTPSFHDLKKVASSMNLHRRSASSSRSRDKSECVAQDDGIGHLALSKSRGNVLELFRQEGGLGPLAESRLQNNVTEDMDDLGIAFSRKSFAKQVKLTKRVSDLEAKLDAARKQLELAVSTAPPMPSMPATFRHRPLPRDTDASRGFAPALPTLLSESLLLHAPSTSEQQHHDKSQLRAMKESVHGKSASALTHDVSCNNELLHESARTDSSASKKNPAPTGKGSVTKMTPTGEDALNALGIVDPPLPTTFRVVSDAQAFLVESSSSHTCSSKNCGQSPRMTKGYAQIDGTHCRESQINTFHDTDGKGAIVKKIKSRSKGGIEADSAKRLHVPPGLIADAASPKHKSKKDRRARVLRNTASLHKRLPPTLNDTAVASRRNLNTDYERMATLTHVVPATTCTSHERAAEIPSIVNKPYNSPTGIPRSTHGSHKLKISTPTKHSSQGNNRQSSSPVLDSAHGQAVYAAKSPWLVDANSQILKRKGSFEWPEDVF